MDSQQNTGIKFYKGCGDLPIYNFYQVMETGLYDFLVVGYDEYQGIKELPITGREHWQSIYNEYCQLTKNNTALTYYNLVCEINYMETRFQVIPVLISGLAKATTGEIQELYYAELRAWGYKIQPAISFEEQLENLQRQWKGSKNTIELKRDDLEKLKKSISIDKTSLTEMVVRLEQILNRNDINPRTTSVEKWIMLHKEAERIVESKRNAA